MSKRYCTHRIFRKEGITRNEAQKLARRQHKALGGFLFVDHSGISVKVPIACPDFNAVADQHLRDII